MVGRLLFVHGAGGFFDDAPLANGLAQALHLDLCMPELSDTAMGFEDWAAPVRQHLDRLGSDDAVIAHSFGASILVRVLAEHRRERPLRATLLAMPDWTPHGWDVTDYAFTTQEPETDLTLVHCRDDDVVPISHLASNSTALPSARAIELSTGGHQFDGMIEAVAAEIRGFERPRGDASTGPDPRRR
ncbi:MULTISPECIES: alpha/beta fold hydrolase [Rhodococcus]|uniref:Alpha/beta hydrolase n=1 Tax=Rhodococcus cerastii TaxID=908616 RepID=A0ABU4CVA1_9NOCA|nr:MULTISPECIES: alpha/beta hydrolase [Rhodococcus]MDV6301287.1 alpha/beta hydrolase [Rhodococcus cerastii]MDV7987748.1 alpha/beta hydrolase [Rhodococcus sp. IEGM 1374]